MIVRSYLQWIVLLLIYVLDLVTKFWASASLEYQQPVALIPWLNLTLMHNYGAAFSFLSDESGWQRWFFTLIAVCMSLVLVFWIRKLSVSQFWLRYGLVMILAGALGNLTDRLWNGYVVDFIDVYYPAKECLPLFSYWQGGCHWPAFNVADSAITIGVVLVFIDVLIEMRQKSKK